MLSTLHSLSHLNLTQPHETSSIIISILEVRKQKMWIGPVTCPGGSEPRQLAAEHGLATTTLFCLRCVNTPSLGKKTFCLWSSTMWFWYMYLYSVMNGYIANAFEQPLRPRNRTSSVPPKPTMCPSPIITFSSPQTEPLIWTYSNLFS